MNVLARTQDLFGRDAYPVSPQTEGIKYAGSKLKLLPQILWLVEKTNAKVVFDGFSGSTRVSQALARYGYKVICNDRAIWSDVFGRCYLQSRPRSNYERLISHLNACSPRDGWFTAHYGGEAERGGGTALTKMPWQAHNTRRLDGIREEIDRMGLEPDERAVALTSLILALDRVDSTLGHFSSYLREWSPRSFNKMLLEVPRIVESDVRHEVTRSDIFDAVGNIEADVAYLDPPYGSNNEKMPPSRVRYSAYYHVWTTICLNDQPNLFGKVNRRADTRDDAQPSVFEEFRRNDRGRFIAVEAVHRLIRETPTKHIILSYSSGGRATATELHEAMNDVGQVLEVIEVDYRRNVMADMVWTNEWLRDAQEPNREFLFLVQKR
jgi:adenine-specific DNA-methyltransferase